MSGSNHLRALGMRVTAALAVRKDIEFDLPHASIELLRQAADAGSRGR